MADTARTYTDDDIDRWAPDTGVAHDARNLQKKFTTLGVSADGTWLLGQCQGSGKEPYQVSVDLADAEKPTFRCNCPSRKFPCKHGLGLVNCWVKDKKKFKAQEPTADLLAKREKNVERKRKIAEAPADAPAGDPASSGPASSGPAKKPNAAALKKKIAAQREGLDLLEKLVLDLASSGQWFEKTRLEKLRRQAPQLGDAYLNAAMYLVNRLVLIGDMEDLSDEERMARGADLVAQLWQTTQKGKAYLDERLDADDTQADADAVMEGILGKTWQLTELKEHGYWGTDLKLIELAYERYDDHARAQRMEISHLLDLNDGRCLQGLTMRPFKGMKFINEQPSYTQVLTIAEAAIYPGYINRRVRWKGGETAEDVTKAHLKAAYAKALPDFKPAFDALKQQMKHPLAPREAVFLVQVAKVGPVGDQVVLEDARGMRLEATNRPRDDAPLDSRKRRASKKKKRAGGPEPVNLSCLEQAAGEFADKEPAVLARLYLLPVASRVVAEPLALLTPDRHLRLGF